MAFVAIHRYERHPQTRDYYALRKVWPRTALAISYSDEILEVSPIFAEVHKQAMEAEAGELDQLTGIGLRKALEYLVKDFAIRENPAEEARIKVSFLGNVIRNYLKDPNVQACAARATWLGNDEAHYIRRWEDRDIEDLKRLIRLTVNWIENVLLTAKYVAEIPEPPT